jgi:Zn finger protein HypA/HybF involved in hydrogenase expression
MSKELEMKEKVLFQCKSCKEKFTVEHTAVNCPICYSRYLTCLGKVNSIDKK